MVQLWVFKKSYFLKFLLLWPSHSIIDSGFSAFTYSKFFPEYLLCAHCVCANQTLPGLLWTVSNLFSAVPMQKNLHPDTCLHQSNRQITPSLSLWLVTDKGDSESWVQVKQVSLPPASTLHLLLTPEQMRWDIHIPESAAKLQGCPTRGKMDVIRLGLAENLLTMLLMLRSESGKEAESLSYLVSLWREWHYFSLAVHGSKIIIKMPPKAII